MKKLINKKTPIAFLLLFTIQSAYAASEPFSPFVQKVIDLLVGPLGTSLAILGIAGAAIGAIFGRIDLMKFAIIFMGIAVLFGAANLVEYFK